MGWGATETSVAVPYWAARRAFSAFADELELLGAGAGDDDEVLVAVADPTLASAAGEPPDRVVGCGQCKES